MLQFKLPAAHYVRIPAGEAQGFTPLRPPRACCHIQPRTGLRSSGQRAGWLPLWEVGDGREEPTSQLHTCLEGKVIEEIRNFLEWEGGMLGGVHQVGCCGFGGRGF